MKSTLKWGLMCLVIYFIFLVVKLPAVHVIDQLSLPKTVNITGVTGSIWRGRAQQVSYMGLPVENVTWSLSAIPLLFGNISAEVKGGNIRQSEQISVNGNISVSDADLVATDMTLYLPADLVMLTLPLPIPVQAEGRFKVTLSELDYTYATGCEQLTGNGQWLNAKVDGVNKQIDLGSFKADLNCENNQILVSVKEPNKLGLDAQVTVPADMKFSIKGRFKPADSLPNEVHQAALFFGKKGSDGYYPIQF